MCLRLGWIASVVLVASLGIGRPGTAGANQKAERSCFRESLMPSALGVLVSVVVASGTASTMPSASASAVNSLMYSRRSAGGSAK